jgi:hypothetical protein
MYNLNQVFMISGKGILYTVIGAASAAALAGTMLTGGTRGEKLRSMRSGVQSFFSSIMRRRMPAASSNSSMQRAEYNQVSSMGHS